MTSASVRGAVKRWLPHAAAAAVLALLLVWDRQTYEAIAGYRSPFLDWMTDRVAQLRGATFPAGVGIALIAYGLIARRRRIRRAGLAMMLTMLLAGGINSIMKEVIGRPGPEIDDISGESWLDARYGRFPSSHSAITFGAAETLSAFVPAVAVPGYALAVLVSYERIYRGTHWPSDIFAGIWIGLVIARYVIARIARTSWSEDLARLRSTRRARSDVDYDWADKRPGGSDRQPAG